LIALQRWLSAALSIVLAWGLTARAALAAPGPADFSVFAYELELRIDRGLKIVAGRERIRLRGTGEELAAVAFPLNGIKVLSVRSVHGDPLVTVTENDRLEVRPPVPIVRGEELAMVVEYSAAEPKGVEFHADAVYTSFHTCTWMVCRDRPDDKATFTLEITVPDGLTLVASGTPVGGRRPEGAPGRQVWHERVPSSPYLFGFVLGRLSRTARTHRGVTLEHFAAPEDQARLPQLLAEDDRMLDFFVAKAGRPLARPFYLLGRAREVHPSLRRADRNHPGLSGRVRRGDPCGSLQALPGIGLRPGALPGPLEHRTGAPAALPGREGSAGRGHDNPPCPRAPKAR
jgi:aminopeptidase N